MKKIITFSFLILAPFLAFGTGSGFPTVIQNPLSVASLTDLINLIFEVIITIGTPILVIMIILVGFKFVMAKGNTGKLEEARRSLMYTLIGAAIILGAWAIEKTLENTVDQLKQGVVYSGATISYNLESESIYPVRDRLKYEIN